MSGEKRERRQLQGTVKQQKIEYSVLLGDRWSQPLSATLNLKNEIVPPERRKSPRRFLGYTTMFEALAVAETQRNRVLVVYQTAEDPVIPKGKQHWYGRFHVFATKLRSKRPKGKKAVRVTVLTRPDQLPAKVIRMRVIGLYRNPHFDSDVQSLLRDTGLLETKISDEGLATMDYPTKVRFLRVRQKETQTGVVRHTKEKTRELHGALIDLIVSQGVLQEDEVHELRTDEEIVVETQDSRDKSQLKVFVDEINLASLDEGVHGATRAVTTDNLIAQDDDRVKYYEGRVDLADSTVLIGEDGVQRGFVWLLSTLHHECLHLRQHHRARRVIEDWRRTKTQTPLLDWFKKQMGKGRSGYTADVLPNVAAFSALDDTHHTRGLNEMNPYLQQLSLSLIVESWDAPDFRKRLTAFAIFQFRPINTPDPSLEVITKAWRPTFRARFQALDAEAQAKVRTAIKSIGEGQAKGLADYLTEALP